MKLERFAKAGSAIIRFSCRAGLWIVIGMLVTAGHSEAGQSADAQNNLDAVIAAFVQAPPFDRETVERVLGAKLVLFKSDNWVHRYAAEDVELADTTIDRVEYSEAAQAKGQLLVLTLGGKCISGIEIMRRYKGFVPGRGSWDDPDPLDDWDEKLPWGRLSLEFRSSTGCLHDVVFDVTTKA